MRTVGCTTLGQPEDDVRIARGLTQLRAEQRAALLARAEPIKGPQLEDWKQDDKALVSLRDRPTDGDA
jgi:uncharacterized protein